MKKFFLFYGMLLLFPITVMSQSIIYEYDSNGNVIYRKLVLNTSLASKSENSTTLKFNYDSTCSKVKILIERLSDESKKTDVAVYDGKNNFLLEKSSFTGNTGEVDLSNKRSGIYIVKASNDEIINSTTIYKK